MPVDSFFKAYLKIILHERQWSWLLVAMVYLIFGLAIRSFFLHPLTRHARGLERSQRQILKRNYLNHCAWGWVFFSISFFMTVAVWNTATSFPMTLQEAAMILGSAFFYVLSVIFHVAALGVAALETLKQLTESEKSF